MTSLSNNEILNHNKKITRFSYWRRKCFIGPYKRVSYAIFYYTYLHYNLKIITKKVNKNTFSELNCVITR
jgi:hypothetical protein